VSVSQPKPGVLALQGDFAAHLVLFSALGAEARPIRRARELEEIDGLVIPGGESTTLAKLIDTLELREPLREFASSKPVLGTCAGAILLARKLTNSGGVEPLGVMDIDVERNGFGRQIDSFEDEIGLADALASEGPARGVFIRAPRIRRVGKGLEVLAVYGQEAVVVREGRHLALTFHPEINGDPRWHARWLEGLA
jgi:5'-phosphate synthase pdxT subunit